MHNILIGIDIGSSLTKVIEAEVGKDAFEILSLESFPTPYKDSEIDKASFFELLYKNIPSQRLKSALISISVPSSAINFSIFDLPKMPKDELDKVIAREALRKILPVPSQQDVLKYTFLREIKVKGSVQSNFLVGAGSKPVIGKYLDLFKSEGITPHFIGSTPLSIMMSFYEYKVSPAGNWAFIDIGFRNTSVVIFSKTDLVLIRNIPFAAFDFVSAFAKKTAIDFSKALDLFMQGKIMDDSISSSWQYLLTELRRSFAYFKEITDNQRIDSLLFSGGMFKAGQTFDYLKRSMGGNLELFDLAAIGHISAKRIPRDLLACESTLFATALGLALSLRPNKRPVLNFIPAEVYQEKKLRKLRIISVKTLFITSIILGCAFILLSTRIVFVKVQLRQLNKDFSESEYKRVSEQAAKINARLGNINKQKEWVTKIVKQGFNWDKFFIILSKNIPANVFIEELKIKYASESQGPETTGEMGQIKSSSKRKVFVVNMNALAVGNYEYAKRETDKFYRGLIDSGFFTEVNLAPIKLEDILMKDRPDKAELTDIKDREFSITAISRPNEN